MPGAQPTILIQGLAVDGTCYNYAKTAFHGTSDVPVCQPENRGRRTPYPPRYCPVPTLDFLVKDAIKKGADSKGVCVGGGKDLSQERSPIVRFSPLTARNLVHPGGVGRRRGEMIAVIGPGVSAAASADVIPPERSPRVSLQVPSRALCLRGAGDSRTNADP